MNRLVFFDPSTAMLDRRAFAHETVYQSELEAIFADCWLFVGPGYWLEREGDYLATTLGDEPVVLWRLVDGTLVLFRNQCRRGPGRIFATGRGQAQFGTCECHGFAYGAGTVANSGLPLEPVGRLGEANGLLFATLAPQGPNLREQLKDFAWYFDRVLGLPGGANIHGETSFRSTIATNWKIAIEAFCGGPTQLDWEASFGTGGDLPPQDMTAAAGTGTICAAIGDELIPLQATLFPNMAVDMYTNSLHVFHPRGPQVTEIETFCVVANDTSAEARDSAQRNCQFLGGTAGLHMQASAQIWTNMATISRGPIARRQPVCFDSEQGQERRSNLPGLVGSPRSEIGQRAFYTWWRDKLAHRGRREVSFPPTQYTAPDIQRVRRPKEI